MADYSHERKEPSVPQCKPSSVKVTFDGARLTLEGTTAEAFPAVSGKRDGKKTFAYSVERQKLSHEGPIPAGEYWINPKELWENAWYKSGSVSAWGNYRITLHVFHKTETYDRGGFFIHGGAIPGSAGCIDLTTYMDSFVKSLKAALKDAGDCYVAVTVRY